MSMVPMAVGGVDTHADIHVAAVIGASGGILGVESFPADKSAYEALLGWFLSHGEIKLLESMPAELVADTAPSLVGLCGVGTDTAATLLVAAGDNPDRLRSERSWAHLCGVCPSPRVQARQTDATG